MIRFVRSLTALSIMLFILDQPSFANSLVSSTLIGGSGMDGAWPASIITVDDDGYVYATGMTASVDFPVTAGSVDPTFNGGDSDIFVAKFSPDLHTLLAATFIGGSGADSARAIRMGNEGYLYIAGTTESSDFPVVTGCFDTTYNGGTESPYGSGDSFVIRINTDLSQLSAGTFIGGTGHDIVNKILMNSASQIVITGHTSSSDFPVTVGAFSTQIQSGGQWGEDTFVGVLNNDLSAMNACSYIGGTGDDYSESMVMGNDDSIYIGGWSSSTDFPTTDGAFDRDYNGYLYDSFVSRFSHDLSTLEASTYVGGSSWDFVYAMSGSIDGSIYVAGHTASTDFPITSQAYDTTYNSTQGPNQGDDVFITRLNAELSAVTASTFLGGSKWENAYSLAVDASAGVIVAGSTSSIDFPVGVNALQSQFHGGSKYSGDTFISNLNPDLTELKGSTYFGGSGDDGGQWLVCSTMNRIYYAGFTSSDDFPITEGAFQTTFAGESDSFIALLDVQLTGDPAATPTASVSPTPAPCQLGVTLWMPAHQFAPGNPCACSVTVCNDTASPLIGYPLFVILDVGGTLFFGPGFTAEFSNYLAQHASFNPGETDVEVLPEFLWPSGAGQASGILWYAGLTDPSMTRLEGGYDIWEFGWTP